MVEISDNVYSGMIEQAAQGAKQLRELQQGLDGLQGTAESEDGFVSVTVGMGGGLVSLELDPRIYRKPDSAALARTIVDTIERANEDVSTRSKELADEVMPDFLDDGDTDPVLGPLMRAFDRKAGDEGVR